jgi:hypothetical protein
MLRTLLALLLACLLTAGVEDRLADAVSGEIATSGDCCPEPLGAPEGEPDCCDVDLGLCCATGSVALNGALVAGLPARGSIDIAAWVPPPAALATRATGPPPTPPPIG